MEERVNLNNQLESVAWFREQLKAGKGKEAFNQILEILRAGDNSAKSIVLDGRKLSDYSEFKTYYPIFLKIQKDNIDKKELLNSLPLLNPPELAKGFIDTNSLLIDVTDMANNPTSITKINDTLSFTYSEMNRILQGIEDFLKTEESLKIISDEFLHKKIALKLYGDAYEIYIKVLKEIYSKIKKIKTKDIENKELYDYLDKNWPILREGADNRLRNDDAHVNYGEREKYSSEELLKMGKILLIRSMTAVIAKNSFIYEFYEEMVNDLMKRWDSKNKIN